MTSFRTLSDLTDLSGQTALVRVDFNVPMEGGKVSDDTRLRAALPTINALRDRGAKVVLMAHFGRPKGQPNPEMSLRPVVEPLELLLSAPVWFAEDCIGEAPRAVIADDLAPGGVALLENVRFHAGEEANDPDFAAELAKLGDIYVNDAFSAAHRAHASTEGLARLLPAYAGESMRRELDALDKALGNPVKPVLGIVGGAKVSSKLDLLKNLVAQLDHLAIGGGMANTFLFAQGVDIGGSLCEKDMADTAREIIEEARRRGANCCCPWTWWWAKAVKPGVESGVRALDRIAADDLILDAGPETVARLQARHGPVEDPDLERPAGRVRGAAVRQGHGGGRAPRRRTGEGRQDHRRRGRGRHRLGPEPRGCGGRHDLRLHHQQRLPGMDGGQAPAGRRGPARPIGGGRNEPFRFPRR